jgi:hypothetical protein
VGGTVTDDEQAGAVGNDGMTCARHSSRHSRDAFLQVNDYDGGAAWFECECGLFFTHCWIPSSSGMMPIFM